MMTLQPYPVLTHGRMVSFCSDGCSLTPVQTVHASVGSSDSKAGALAESSDDITLDMTPRLATDLWLCHVAGERRLESVQ